MGKITKISEGQVYKFRPSKEGLVVVMEVEGELKLVDTYWKIFEKDTYDQVYSLERANEIGKLIFYFDLNEVEEIDNTDTRYYDDDDLFQLTKQNACNSSCILWYKKKDAKRSPKKMGNFLQGKIDDLEYTIEYSMQEIAKYSDKLDQVRDGNVDIQI